MFTTPDDELVTAPPPPATQAGGFSVPENELVSDDYWGDVWGKTKEAFTKDLPRMAGESVSRAGKVGRAMVPGAFGESIAQMTQGTPALQTPMGQAGKAAYEMGKDVVGGAVQGIKDTGSLIGSGLQYTLNDEIPFAETSIGQKFRERPISVPLGVAGTLAGARQGYKAYQGRPSVPPVPPEMPGAGAAPEAPPTGPAGAAPPPTTPLGAFEGFANKFKETITPRAEDLGRYINRIAQKADKAGMFADVPDYTQEISQMMAVQSVGGGPNYAIQARRVGKTPIQINDELRAIGQYVIDEDINKPELGNKNMMETQQRLMDEAGGRIGGVRLMADDVAPAGPAYKTEILQTLKGELGRKLSKAQYKEALKIVQDHESSYKGMADAATELNSEANKANKNHQPHTPFTEVANIISTINNERIRGVVGPEVSAVYDSALKEFGVNMKIQNFLARKVGQGLHRLGPGTLKRAFAQKFLDEIGYKGGSRALNKVSGKIKANPGLVKNLPELFKTFINEVEELFPEAENKAFGGIVGEMDAYLTPKYGGKP